MASSSSQSGQQSSNPQTSREIWHRVGHVEVIIWQGEKAKRFDFDGLDFKFSVTQILGRMPEGNMSVSICGLSQDTANQLVTLCSTHEALMQRKTLKLYAGYADPEDKNYRGELLATMDIVNATISSPPPDMWLQITAVYAGWLTDIKFAIDVMDMAEIKTSINEGRLVGHSAMGGAISEVRELGVTFKSTANYIPINLCLAQICNGLNTLQDVRGVKIKYKWDTTAVRYGELCQGKTRHFACCVTLDEIPVKISETYKVNAIWEERNDNEIWLAVYPDPRYTKDMSEEDKNKYTRGKTIKFLDVDHGLIGIPKLKDSIKLECRCFLDGKIKAGDYVSVKSAVMPVIYEYGEEIKPNNKSLAEKWGSGSWSRDKDGKPQEGQEGTVKAYQIMKIKYSGHLRGNEWYCDIEGRRPFEIKNKTTEAKPRPIRLTEDFAKKLEGWEIDESTGTMTLKKT